MALGWWQRWREQRAQQREIPETLWQATLDTLPFVRRWPPEDLAALRQLVRQFLDEKEFSGAGGLEVNDAMALCIAVQACLPMLRLGLGAYAGFVGIVVLPQEITRQQTSIDAAGVVHAHEQVVLGEVVPGGPLMVTWPAARSPRAGPNGALVVVIHEFAHVIDQLDGELDGVPPLPDARARKRWEGVLQLEYERFCRSVDSGEATALDAVGADHPAEFFGVAAEAFFINPESMRDEHPWLYPLFVEFFRQDPGALPPLEPP